MKILGNIYSSKHLEIQGPYIGNEASGQGSKSSWRLEHTEVSESNLNEEETGLCSRGGQGKKCGFYPEYRGKLLGDFKF